MNAVSFDRAVAFSRTLGLVTPEEMDALATKTVAIAGLGGVGGSHLLTLTRLGIGRFHLADFDSFDVENFNRQAGATLDSVGKPKIEVMAALARKVNPALEIRSFPEGVTRDNLSSFLDGVDVYLDGLDFFAFDIRSAVFHQCYQRGIPAVTAAPLAMGTALINFLPGGMTFDDYFNWKRGDGELLKSAKFLAGLAPTLMHRHSLIDRRYVDLSARKGPSSPMGCELCAGFAGTEVMKILLKRGNLRAAPRSMHFDAYTNRFHSRRVWLGNRNPWQKVKIRVLLRLLGQPKQK